MLNALPLKSPQCGSFTSADGIALQAGNTDSMNFEVDLGGNVDTVPQ